MQRECLSTLTRQEFHQRYFVDIPSGELERAYKASLATRYEELRVYNRQLKAQWKAEREAEQQQQRQKRQAEREAQQQQRQLEKQAQREPRRGPRQVRILNGQLTPPQRFAIFKRDSYRCRLCGAFPEEDDVKLHVDHIIPRSKGGSNDPKNLWTLCSECNIGKGKHDL